MLKGLFNNIAEKDKVAAIDDLISDSTPRPSFFFLVILSITMATLGLLLDNVAIIIGSMLIAPILSPVMSMALGIVMADNRLMMRSLITIVKASGLAIALAALTTYIFGAGANLANAEIVSRTHPDMAFLAIAIIAGTATAFARVKPELNDTLPGTAIAVALVPPLAVSGIGVAIFNWQIATGALLMFIVNTVGIVFAAMVMFSLMNLYTKRARAKKVVAKEDKELKARE